MSEYFWLLIIVVPTKWYKMNLSLHPQLYTKLFSKNCIWKDSLSFGLSLPCPPSPNLRDCQKVKNVGINKVWNFRVLIAFRNFKWYNLTQFKKVLCDSRIFIIHLPVLRFNTHYIDETHQSPCFVSYFMFLFSGKISNKARFFFFCC